MTGVQTCALPIYPLRLAPKDPKDLKDMQTREINNGRLGMLAAAGIIAQETITGKGFTELEAVGPTVAAGATGIGLIWAASLAFWDLADDKNAGFQGKDQGGAADRWKFGADRYENYEYGASEAVLTGVAPPAPARPAFDGKAYAATLPGIYATVAPGHKGLWDPLGFCSPDITKAKVDFYRDAETKHGAWACWRRLVCSAARLPTPSPAALLTGCRLFGRLIRYPRPDGSGLRSSSQIGRAHV